MADLPAVLASLRRAPDVEAPDLTAVDASDRLILAEAEAALGAVDGDRVAVVGDRYGALTLGAATTHGHTGLRVHQDPITGEQALSRNAARLGLSAVYTSHHLDADLFRGVGVVLLQLPRSLAELTEIAEAVARWADPDVALYAAGRLKHMSRSMNDVLARSFTEVTATRAAQKSRGLIARGPMPTDPPTFPTRTPLPELDLTVVAHGAVFAGGTLDLGTRVLLRHVDRIAPDARRIVDLGCGTGLLAIAAARARPDADVVASDRSAAAVASARATAELAGVRLEVRREDAAAGVPDASADVVLCNPPFHEHTALHTGGAAKLIAAAGRVLRPGGEMWTVYNGHLHHRGVLARAVGPTEIVDRTPKFVVTRSVRV